MAGPKTDANGRIQKRDENSGKSELQGLLQRMQPEIVKALPKHVNPDRMARIILTALSGNAQLQQCTPTSFLGAVVQASQLGLEVNTPLGHAYLLPYRDNKNNRSLCQLIIGYQGMIELARRSGMVRGIYAFAVYPGDEFRWELGLEPSIVHRPSNDPLRETDAEGRARPITHVYAVARLNSGDPIFTVLTKAQVDRYRARSRAGQSGPWVTDYVSMALKTAVRRLFPWLPKSAEMAVAAAVDEALERNESQLSASDPEVLDILGKHGIDTNELPIPGGEYVDAHGEVHAAEPAEPGSGDAP